MSSVRPSPISLKGLVQISDPPFRCSQSCDVFVREDPQLGKVALKRYRLDSRGYFASARRQFKREAAHWGQLAHPNLLPFYGAVEEGGYMYLVSPWIANGTLPEYLQERPDADKPELIAQVSQGIHYLHSKGIIHGDIKGSNIYISEASSAILADFGLSKMVDDVTSESLKGSGSARWMSPEVIIGEARTHASDVYAFGIVIAEILSSRLPYEEYGLSIAVKVAIITRGLRPVMEPSTSPDGRSYEALWAIASRCWALEAKARPTMAAIVEELVDVDPDLIRLQIRVQEPAAWRKGSMVLLLLLFAVSLPSAFQVVAASQ